MASVDISLPTLVSNSPGSEVHADQTAIATVKEVGTVVDRVERTPVGGNTVNVDRVSVAGKGEIIVGGATHRPRPKIVRIIRLSLNGLA
jgi:hypothetical protein